MRLRNFTTYTYNPSQYEEISRSAAGAARSAIPGPDERGGAREGPVDHQNERAGEREPEQARSAGAAIAIPRTGARCGACQQQFRRRAVSEGGGGEGRGRPDRPDARLHANG